MKKIKLLFASLILLFVISSCDESIKKEIDSEKVTTIEILEHLPKDTVVIVKSENVFYVLNKDNLVEYKLYGGDYRNTTVLILFLVCAILCMIVVRCAANS